MSNSFEILPANESRRAALDRRIHDKVAPDIEYFIDKLKELADGVWIFYKKPDGSVVKAYKQPPDAKAITYLLDRVLGKPSQQVETRQQSSGIISVQHIIKNLVDGKVQATTSTNQLGEGVGLDTVSE